MENFSAPSSCNDNDLRAQMANLLCVPTPMEAVQLVASMDSITLSPKPMRRTASFNSIIAVDEKAKNGAFKARRNTNPTADEAGTSSSILQLQSQLASGDFTDQSSSIDDDEFIEEHLMEEPITPENLLKFESDFIQPHNILARPNVYDTPNPKASTKFLDLPFDIIRDVCDHVVNLYPPASSNCTKGTIQNWFTGKEETRLELNSTDFKQIVQYLNGGPAQQDLESLLLACGHLNGFVKKSMDSIHKTLLGLQPIRVEAIWFEDLSYLLASVNDYGLSKISNITLYWDPRPRNVGTLCAPWIHRADAAAAHAFDILAYKCVNLRTITITIAPELLLTMHPAGWPRFKPYGSYLEIKGMAELKTLIQCVRGRRGHVNIRLALDDFAGDKDKKKLLLQWLKEPMIT